jgi:hypothetical protein
MHNGRGDRSGIVVSMKPQEIADLVQLRWAPRCSRNQPPNPREFETARSATPQATSSAFRRGSEPFGDRRNYRHRRLCETMRRNLSLVPPRPH